MTPEPYYDDGTVRLYLGRCEDVLPHLSGVQLTVTSPPYNQLENAKPRGGIHARGTWTADVAALAYEDEVPEPEYQAQQVVMAKLVAEASTPDAAMFYNHKLRWRGACLHPYDIVRQFDGWALRSEIIWRRRGGVAVNARMFLPSDERIYWLVRDLRRFVWHQRAMRWGTVWDMDASRQGRLFHPCPYPAQLPERAMLATTSRGDLVCDPYAGSGTTLRVAKALGRRAVGIEAHEPYAEAAATMLEAM